MKIDIFISKLNIGFEFNGVYWHSEQAGKGKNYHMNKQINAQKEDIKLYHIWEWDWNTNPEIIKSWIKDKLHCNNEKIYARNCQIKFINSIEKKYFLEQYHIQGGNIITKYNIGLYNNDKLVSVMCINKNQYKNEKY